MVKGLTLTGTEKKIEVSGGLHVFVMNFSTDTELLVSKTPNAVKGKEGTYVIAPKTGIMVQDACTMGTIEGVSDYRGELYAKGTGYAQFVPTNSLNFSVVGGGGDSSSPTPVIENPLHIKGIVATVEDLPDTGEVGDMYFVGNPDTDEDLAEYVYIGNKFEKLGTVSKDKDLVGILGKLVETVGYEHNNYIAPDGVTFANYEMYSFHEEIEPDLVLAKNGGMSNLYTHGELTNAFAVTHYVNSNLTLDRNVEEMHLIADYDVTSNTTADEAIVSMTYTCIDEDGDEALDSLIFPIDLTNKGGTSRAGIKLPEDAIGVEENVVALQVNGTHEFDITLRLNLIKVPKGTEIDYDTYEWKDPTWSVSSALDSILLYMHNDMPDEIRDRVIANITPTLNDLKDSIDNLEEEMPTKADHSEIIADNLIPTPYGFLTKENSPVIQNGVTFTLNDDGTILINGTNEKSSNLNVSLATDFIIYKDTDYTLYDGVNVDGFRLRVTEKATGDIIANDSYSSSQPNDRPITFSVDEDKICSIYLSLASGCTLDNVICKPMLEVSKSAHGYQPYDLSRKALRKDIEAVKEEIPRTTLERVQNTTRVITVPEKSTFASVSKIEGKTLRSTTSLDSAPVNKITSEPQYKNLFDNEYYLEYPDSTDGVWTVSSSSYSVKVPVEEGKTYYVVKPNKDGNRFRLWMYADKPEIGSVGIRKLADSNTRYEATVTVEEGEKYIGLFVSSSSAMLKPDIYVGELPYEEYIAQAYKKELILPPEILNLPDYGVEGNILDLENMKYYHNSTVANLEDATWSSLSSPGGVIFKTTTFKPVKENPSVFMCIKYGYVENYDMFYENPMNAVSTTSGNIYIRDRSCSTLSELQEVIKGIKIAYELATPEVIDLKTIIPPIAVTPNGTLTFNNEYNLDIPTEVIYKKEG